MANTIKIKRGANAPESLSSGELGFDNTNEELYIGDSEGTPTKIGASLPLSVENGGTGNPTGKAPTAGTADLALAAEKLNTARNMKVNLGAEWDCWFDGNDENLVQLGVMGTLPISHGGTGATTKNQAAINLLNYTTSLPSEDTPEAWSVYGPGHIWRPGDATADHIKSPSTSYTYGHILHIPYTANSKEFCQIWLSAPVGDIYVRGSNSEGWYGNADKSSDWKNIALQSYPVGSVYMSFTATSPAAIFGGNWTRIEHRFLYGAGDQTDLVNTTGGETTHTLTTSEIPAHTHGNQYTAETWYSKIYKWLTTSSGSAIAYGPVRTGGGAAHNNMPPYICVYMWYRDS